MNITTIIYRLDKHDTIIKIPFRILKETEKCYFTASRRYLKRNIGLPALKSPSSYPYIELYMVDADETLLRSTLSRYFIEEAVKSLNTEIEEICPHCDYTNTLKWNGISKTTICQDCGKEILLCSVCDDFRCGRCLLSKCL